MGRKRQAFSKDFKAKVALEALREESTIQEIAVKYGVHPIRFHSGRHRQLYGVEPPSWIKSKEVNCSKYLLSCNSLSVTFPFCEKSIRGHSEIRRFRNF